MTVPHNGVAPPGTPVGQGFLDNHQPVPHSVPITAVRKRASAGESGGLV